MKTKVFILGLQTFSVLGHAAVGVYLLVTGRVGLALLQFALALGWAALFGYSSASLWIQVYAKARVALAVVLVRAVKRLILRKGAGAYETAMAIKFVVEEMGFGAALSFATVDPVEVTPMARMAEGELPN